MKMKGLGIIMFAMGLFLNLPESNSISVFNFIKGGQKNFNKAFVNKHFKDALKTLAPKFNKASTFYSDFSYFLQNESSNILIEHSGSAVKIPKYFFQLKIKKNEIISGSVGLISNKPISLYDLSGNKLTAYLVSSEGKKHLSAACKKIEGWSKASYFEVNSIQNICKAHFVVEHADHPAYVGRVIARSSNSDKETVDLVPKILYPGFIKEGLPKEIKYLGTEWRAAVSRYRNGSGQSTVYTP